MKTTNLLILVSIIGRLIPHPANFTPVGAVSLIGGAKLTRAWRWTIPFIALVLTDLLLGFSFTTPFVYAAFAINILLGQWIRGDHRYLKLGGLCVAGSLQFFLITNLAVWVEGLLYPQTLSGLAQCYAAGVPFLKNTLLGDLCWSYGLYVVVDRAQAWVSKRRLQTA